MRRALDPRGHRVPEDGAGRGPHGGCAVDRQRQAAEGAAPQAEVVKTAAPARPLCQDSGRAKIDCADVTNCTEQELRHTLRHRRCAKITVPDEGVESLFGSYDENLKHLEAQFSVRIRTSGHELIVEGDAADVARAERVLEQLAGADARRLQARQGGREDRRAARRPGRERRARRLLPARRGPHVRQAAGDAEERQPAALPRRHRQHDIVFGIGPAGTGKTYLAMAQAVSYLLAKRVSRIILARPAVEAGEKLGFLPGDLQEKVNPYLRPLYDALYDMIEIERAERLLERGTIEVAPIAFMRGRTLNDAFVILDEAQNTTSEQMKMFLTRLGFGSKAVITGDITQIDLPSARAVRPGRGDEDRRQRSKASRSSTSTRRTSSAISSCSRSSRPTKRTVDPDSSRAGAVAVTGRAGPSGRVRSRTAAAARCATAARPLARARCAARARRGRHRAGAPTRACARSTAATAARTQPTDVLSFPRSPDAVPIARSSRSPRSGPRSWATSSSPPASRAARRARPGTPMQTELRVLALHGLLHLLGYDHHASGRPRPDGAARSAAAPQGRARRRPDRARRHDPR